MLLAVANLLLPRDPVVQILSGESWVAARYARRDGSSTTSDTLRPDDD
jgi:hypothetical protein